MNYVKVNYSKTNFRVYLANNPEDIFQEINLAYVGIKNVELCDLKTSKAHLTKKRLDENLNLNSLDTYQGKSLGKTKCLFPGQKRGELRDIFKKNKSKDFLVFVLVNDKYFYISSNELLKDTIKQINKDFDKNYRAKFITKESQIVQSELYFELNKNKEIENIEQKSENNVFKNQAYEIELDETNTIISLSKDGKKNKFNVIDEGFKAEKLSKTLEKSYKLDKKIIERKKEERDHTDSDVFNDM